MGAACGSQNSMDLYVPDDDLPKEITAPAEVYFYGMGKPYDKFGRDKGLKEVWTGWHFPSSDDKCVIILPAIEGVHKDWSKMKLSDDYDKRLEAYGLSEANLKEIVGKLNTLLKAFYPFQRDRKKAVKTKFSEQGFNALTGGIDSNTETFYYATQMRKVLAKAGMDFPNTSWSLHIHKMQEGSDGIFREVVYHTVRIDLSEDMPKWWNERQFGSGSAWHVWDQSHSTRNLDLAKELCPDGPQPSDSTVQVPPAAGPGISSAAGPNPTAPSALPEVQQTKGNSPLSKGDLSKGPPASKLAPAGAGDPAAADRLAKRKGSTSDTFAGLEQFSAKVESKSPNSK